MYICYVESLPWPAVRQIKAINCWHSAVHAITCSRAPVISHTFPYLLRRMQTDLSRWCTLMSFLRHCYIPVHLHCFNLLYCRWREEYSTTSRLETAIPCLITLAWCNISLGCLSAIVDTGPSGQPHSQQHVRSDLKFSLGYKIFRTCH